MVLLLQIQKKNLLVVITQEQKPPVCIWESQRHPQHSRDISSTLGRGTEQEEWEAKHFTEAASEVGMVSLDCYPRPTLH